MNPVEGFLQHKKLIKRLKIKFELIATFCKEIMKNDSNYTETN